MVEFRKAQLKIQQMAFVLMAITLFFVLVGMFFLVFRFSLLKDSSVDLQEENAMLLATKLANSPEFSCGNAFDSLGSQCIDADKAMMLKENSGKYSGFWGKGVGSIEIRKIYPEMEEKICTQSNYPDCNVIRLLSEDVEGIYLSNFVALCSKDSFEGEVYDKCEMARVLVAYGGEL